MLWWLEYWSHKRKLERTGGREHMLALKDLARLGHKPPFDVLLKVLSEPTASLSLTSELHTSMYDFVGTRFERVVVALLVKELRSADSEHIRSSAAWQLSHFKNCGESVEILTDALNASSERVRQSALAALQALRPLSSSVWLKALDVPDVTVRNAAVRALRDEALLPDLSAELGRAAAELETINLIRWRDSDSPRAWVSGHDGVWTADDELTLVESLWPIDSDGVKAVIKKLKEEHVPHVKEYVERLINAMSAGEAPEWENSDDYFPTNAPSLIRRTEEIEFCKHMVEKDAVRAIPYLDEAFEHAESEYVRQEIGLLLSHGRHQAYRMKMNQ